MMDFTFEITPWEQALEALHPGDKMDAWELLTLLEEAEEDMALEALDILEQKGVALSIQNLPNLPAGGNMALRLRQEAQLVTSGKLLTGLEENDPLRLYLEELAAMPAADEQGYSQSISTPVKPCSCMSARMLLTSLVRPSAVAAA